MKNRIYLSAVLLPAILCFSCSEPSKGPWWLIVEFPFSNEANRREFPFFAEIYNAVAAASGGKRATISPSFPEEEEYEIPVPIEEEKIVYSFYGIDEEEFAKGYRYAVYDWEIYGGAFARMTFEEGSPAPSSHFAGKTVDLLLARVSDPAIHPINFFLIMTDGDSIFGFPAYSDYFQPPLESWTAEEGCHLYSFGSPLYGGYRLAEPYGQWRWYIEWGKDTIINHGLGIYGTPKKGHEAEGYLPLPGFVQTARLVDDVISDGEENPIAYVTLEAPYKIEHTLPASAYGSRVEN